MDSSVSHNKMTWEEAYLYCYDYNSRLLEIHTEEQMEFINLVQGIIIIYYDSTCNNIVEE